MSFPSQGVMKVYRNPIEEVSRFFNTKYLDHYRIYNCCSEFLLHLIHWCINGLAFNIQSRIMNDRGGAVGEWLEHS